MPFVCFVLQNVVILFPTRQNAFWCRSRQTVTTGHANHLKVTRSIFTLSVPLSAPCDNIIRSEKFHAAFLFRKNEPSYTSLAFLLPAEVCPTQKRRRGVEGVCACSTFEYLIDTPSWKHVSPKQKAARRRGLQWGKYYYVRGGKRSRKLDVEVSPPSLWH